MQIVCLDTHILICGIQGKASPERKEMIDKARKFLQYLSRNKVIILVPAVVLDELLMDIPPDKHERFIQKFSASYQIITALAWRADKIISCDNGVKKLARDFIAVEEIPPV